MPFRFTEFIAARWKTLRLLLLIGIIVAVGCLGYGIYRRSVSEAPPLASIPTGGKDASSLSSGNSSDSITVRLTVNHQVASENASSGSPEPGGANPLEAGQTQAEQAYEEALGSPLEEAIKKVDHVLVEGVQRWGKGSGDLRFKEVAVRSPEKDFERLGAYLFQHILIPPEVPAEPMLQALRIELSILGMPAFLEKGAPGTWRISLQGRVTHELTFETTGQELGPDLSKAKGLLVIVIDDLGLSLRFARELAELPLDITFSVLPRLRHSADVVALANEKGRELMLHQPMEPMAYPETSPGEGALFGSMTGKQLRAVVRDNLVRVPGARGLNNHMGSRFTQDYRGVYAMLEELRGRGLFVLDSLTHPRSVLAKLAAEQEIPVLRRDVFLDVVRSADAVQHQLRKAESIALRKGRAVAIGHPFEETLEGLRRWSAERSPSLAVVRASALLDNGADALAKGKKSR